MSQNPFRYFKTSPEIIQLAVMMNIRFPLSLLNVDDLLHERCIDIFRETIRHRGAALTLASPTRSGSAVQRRCGNVRNGSGTKTETS